MVCKWYGCQFKEILSLKSIVCLFRAASNLVCYHVPGTICRICVTDLCRGPIASSVSFAEGVGVIQ